MERKLKALLVGVNDYITPRAGQCADDTNMPGALVDVENVRTMLEEHAARLGFRHAEGRILTGREQTRRKSVLHGLRWLGDDAMHGDLLLFYFSGHSAWRRYVASVDGSTGQTTTTREGAATREGAPPRAGVIGRDGIKARNWYEVVLCPSDTDWHSIFVSAIDVRQSMATALDHEAMPEIILETCSATGLQDDGVARRNFGDGYDGEGLGRPLKMFTRWDASRLDQSSHSGPTVPCDAASRFGGLFTHFFCQGFFDDRRNAIRSRHELLGRVNAGLQDYAYSFRNCCGRDPFENIPGKLAGQDASLECKDALEALPALTLPITPQQLEGAMAWS